MTIARLKNIFQREPVEAIDLSNFGPISLVVIQPTSFCNLDCDYCYLPNRHLKNRLSPELIEPIFKSILTSPFFKADFSVCWHAGEPLALPISFYRDVFAAAEAANEKYNRTEFLFDYSYQTNGTLITQAWCDFFKEHPVHVGVSIDGPAFLHDAHRKTRDGKGSHELAMRGIRYLQDHDIPHNIIAVITKDSLDYPDEMFNFFLENNICDVGFNFEETEGVNARSSLDRDEHQERFRAFVKRIWELSAENVETFQVREFEVLSSLIYTEERLQQTQMNHPFAIVNFDTQGNFSTFDPELLAIDVPPYGSFTLGNVLSDTLESACSSEKFLKIYRDIRGGVQKCRDTCQYFGICGGGAGSNKYWENGTFNSAETHACRYRIQILTDTILDDLERLLDLA
ncbi:MAG: cyclophane-forming radical SAM/SPASM peptide maturase GrrM/OscB [Spirulina sp.]